MSTTLELVYQYRHLLGKCESGVGLEVDEIDALHTIKALFVGDHPDLDVWRCTRQFAREKVALLARLRSREHDDPVELIEIAPGGMVVGGAPYAAPGSTVELVYDDPELSLSYRFKAKVVWLDEDGDEFLLGLELVGAPLRLHRGPARPRTEAARVAGNTGRVAA